MPEGRSCVWLQSSTENHESPRPSGVRGAGGSGVKGGALSVFGESGVVAITVVLLFIGGFLWENENQDENALFNTCSTYKYYTAIITCTISFKFTQVGREEFSTNSLFLKNFH